jgi:alanine racemase
VDAGALADNTREILRHTGAPLMAVVKSDGYGHGLVELARSALAGGATALGMTSLGDAAELRAAGIRTPLLCWSAPDADPDLAAELDCAVAVAGTGLLRRLAAGTRPVRVHLHLDSGLHRDGAADAEFAALTALAADLERRGRIVVEGVMTHLDHPASPHDPGVLAAIGRFRRAAAEVRRAGLRPRLLHVGGTPAALLMPRARVGMARIGAGIVGIVPSDLVLVRPAMTLDAPLVEVRDLAPGDAVGYGGDWTADRPTRIGLVPVGYGDGLPRRASGMRVWVGGRRHPVVGRMSMNCLTIDLGPESSAAVGDRVVLLGDPRRGEPTAEDWAQAADTIAHEIVTAVGRSGRRRRPVA